MAKLRYSQQPAMYMALRGRMMLAQLMELPEAGLESLAQDIEASPLFFRLASARVIISSEFPCARFAARRFAGRSLRLSGSGLPELVDGNCDLARLMQDVGRERFEKWFLGDAPLSDEERARGCGISAEQARKLREFMDRAFILGEFETASAAPERVFSAVAGICMESGTPTLAFFHREVWKKSCRIDKERLTECLSTLSADDVGKAKDLVRRLEAMERRKTTLYRLLEEILKVQANYLSTGEPGRRQPLMQRDMAKTLGVDPSVLCRLISNKSVQMPWGLEAPLGVFFPSAKDINRDRLYVLACAQPGLTDAMLTRELERVHGVRLSRRSIAQYRKEFSLSAHPAK
jgi:hypothetical protein